MPIITKLSSTSLTILMEVSGKKYVAYCPELDLATQGKTANDVFNDLVEMAMDYAEEYTQDFELFSKSPNRAEHLPYIKAILACKGNLEAVRSLFF